MHRALPSRRALWRSSAVLLGLTFLATNVVPALGASSIGRGPSTSTDPYILPVADDIRITSLLTVNDSGAASNGYEMVGIPDGLGLTKVDDKVTILMNHELRDAPGQEQGIVRRHGQIGAFVSRLVIDPKTLRIKHGSDLIGPGTSYWDYPNGGYVAAGPRWADMTAQQSVVRTVLLGHADRSRRALQRAQRRRLSRPDLLRQRGGRRRRTFVRDHPRRQGHLAAAARAVLVGEHDPGRQPERHDARHGPGRRPDRRQPALGLCRQEDEGGLSGRACRSDQRPVIRARRGQPGRDERRGMASGVPHGNRRPRGARERPVEPHRRAAELACQGPRSQPQSDRGRPLGPEEPQ